MVAAAAQAVLHGQWGTVNGGVGDRFMRDDRMGDITSYLAHMDAASRERAVAEKATALQLQHRNHALWEASILPHLTDTVLADKIDASIQYGVLLYSIILPAWRVMAQGALHSTHNPGFNKTELAAAITDYDAAWAAYRAYGLSEFYAPSLYHPYYLCLGTHCNCAFDPPKADLTNNLHGGVGAAVDALRNVSGLPSPWPQPAGVGETCGSFAGFNCTQGKYCFDHPNPDFSYTGNDDLAGCAKRCEAEASCTCFIHTGTPDPPNFAACKTATWAVGGLAATERGYSAYVRQGH
eukprot:COSAG05_NODE_926_length_6575_cov_6.025324_4_plen_294_part_00